MTPLFSPNGACGQVIKGVDDGFPDEKKKKHLIGVIFVAI